MDKIRNLSIRKTLLLYLAVSLIGCFFLSAAVAKTASRVQERIWWKYADQEQYIEAQTREWGQNSGAERYFVAEVPRPDAGSMSAWDLWISEFCDFLQTYTVLILSVLGSGGAVLLFYRNKLKPPIQELERASARVAEQDLDFQITYQNQDELGRLCREFERMRGQLEENNRRLWRMIEEERVLRASIAHDIRSPLSVLKGYYEMLTEFLPDGTIDTPRAVEMLEECGKQIGRMDAFVETMRQLNSLEQRPLSADRITEEELRRDLEAELAVLGPQEGKRIGLEVSKTGEFFSGDRAVILEVTENLLSNALRYAKEKVEIGIVLSEAKLQVQVRDDGSGFTENSRKETEAESGEEDQGKGRQNMKDSLKHAGMGMYLSRLYCEKHGGKLLAEQRETGGAAVTAVFRRIQKQE